MTAPDLSTVPCDVGDVVPDLRTVGALARLQLNARRSGMEIRLHRPSVELLQLLAFVGLGSVLRVESGGQAEQREQLLGVEEERELDDPAL